MNVRRFGLVCLWLLVGLPLLAVAPPRRADGLGWLVTPAGRSIQPTGLAAVVTWDPRRGEEQLVARLGYRLESAGVQSFGWVLAVPGAPTLAETPPTLFEDLDRYAVPREKPINLLRPEVDRVPGAPDPRSATSRQPSRPRGFDPTAPTGGARLEAQVLPAGDPAALAQWVAANGFSAETAAPVIGRYAAAGWRFIAVRVAAERGLLTGGVTPPLRLSFPTSEPVLPLALAALDASGQPDPRRRLDLQLFTLAPNRLELGTLAAAPTYAESLDPYTALQLTGGLAGGDVRFLTRQQAALEGAQLQADLALRPAANDAEVGAPRMSPAEWAGAILLAALIPVVWLGEGFAQAGVPGLVFGALTLVAALLPLLRSTMRRWWPFVLSLIYLGVAMPAAREVIQRTDVDLAYLAVAVAVALVLLSLWLMRRQPPRPAAAHPSHRPAINHRAESTKPRERG